jgi:hypothetical protein
MEVTTPVTTTDVMPFRGVEHTFDYTKFKSIAGNRKYSEHHVGMLMDSFQNHPELIELRPILVNERMEVLDGQHRLEALRRMNLKVPYQVVPGGNLATIQILNGTQLTWRLLDFVKSFAAAGNAEYSALLEYNRRYSFSTRFMAALIGASATLHVDKLIKSGKFQVREDLEEAESFLRHYEDLMVKSPMLFKSKGEVFVAALYRVWRYEDYDQDRMLAQLDNRPLMPQATRIQYLKELESTYNYKVHGAGYLRFN